MSTPLMVDSWKSLSKCHWRHFATNQLVAELILGNQEQKPENDKQSHDDKRHLLEGPRVFFEQLSLHMLRRELNYFATQELLGCSWGAHHVLDTLKLLVEAACWFWHCPTQESNQSKRKFLEENISWQSLYTVWFKLDFELAWHQLLATDTRGC